ncbi:hypothetical protein STEG23_036603, partial [Scotinomys teguina]
SPPFSTMGAYYRYNPRHGQSTSVPKVWKCRHRRSVTPEEGLGCVALESHPAVFVKYRDEGKDPEGASYRISSTEASLGFNTEKKMCDRVFLYSHGCSGIQYVDQVKSLEPCKVATIGVNPSIYNLLYPGRERYTSMYGPSGVTSEGFPCDNINEQTVKDLPNKDGGAWVLGYRAGTACPFLLHEEREKSSRSELYLDLNPDQSPTEQDDRTPGRLQAVWPPPKTKDTEEKVGLKYTEAEYQTAILHLKREHKEEIENLQDCGTDTNTGE